MEQKPKPSSGQRGRAKKNPTINNGAKKNPTMLRLNVCGANKFWLFLFLENINFWFSSIGEIWGFCNNKPKLLLIILKQNLLHQAKVWIKFVQRFGFVQRRRFLPLLPQAKVWIRFVQRSGFVQRWRFHLRMKSLHKFFFLCLCLCWSASSLLISMPSLLFL